MVICIPLSAVVAGIYTIFLAIESDDGLVSDDYYWQGKQINRVLKRDQFAFSIGLNGELFFKPAMVSLQLSAKTDQTWPEQLQLKILSATRKGMDQTLLLPHLGEGFFQSPMGNLQPGKWYVEAGTNDWRLSGSLITPASIAVQMAPEL